MMPINFHVWSFICERMISLFTHLFVCEIICMKFTHLFRYFFIYECICVKNIAYIPSDSSYMREYMCKKCHVWSIAIMTSRPFISTECPIKRVKQHQNYIPLSVSFYDRSLRRSITSQPSSISFQMCYSLNTKSLEIVKQLATSIILFHMIYGYSVSNLCDNKQKIEQSAGLLQECHTVNINSVLILE